MEAVFLPFTNSRFPFCIVSVPVALRFTPSRPITCFTSGNDIMDDVTFTFADLSCAWLGGARRPTPTSAAAAANDTITTRRIFISISPLWKLSPRATCPAYPGYCQFTVCQCEPLGPEAPVGNRARRIHYTAYALNARKIVSPSDLKTRPERKPYACTPDRRIPAGNQFRPAQHCWDAILCARE